MIVRVPGNRCLIFRGSWLVARGSWLVARGSWYSRKNRQPLPFPRFVIQSKLNLHNYIHQEQAKIRLKCILLAEDDDAVRALLSRSLKRKGYSVVGVKTAAEALRVLGDEDVGILITDVGLPDMSGPDLVEESYKGLPDLPVIFISGYGPEELERRGFLGKGRFLQKPFDLNALKEMVADVLGPP